MSILFPLYPYRKAEDNKISPGSDNGVCPLEKMEGEKERRKEGERNLWHFVPFLNVPLSTHFFLTFYPSSFSLSCQVPSFPTPPHQGGCPPGLSSCR